jgi:hypothetical protein
VNVLVVYESMFGNTQAAHAVADGLSHHHDVRVEEVGRATERLDDDVALLVVGGPTHALAMSRPETRADAAAQAGTSPTVTPVATGLREWLTDLEGPSPTTVAAAFDTRVARPRVPGSAARRAERRLRRLGFRILRPAPSFWVTGTKGPLTDGELERARRWGAALGAEVATAQRHPA